LLYAAFGWLTETLDNVGASNQELLNVFSVPPSPVSCENSAATQGTSQLESGKAADAPSYLNTAFAEAIFNDTETSLLVDDLKLQRDCSRTPWIFNALLNSIEYYAGTPHMTSVAPEIHVSSTGLCNLTCRFCSYTPEIGKQDYLALAGLQNLDVLKSVKTLRLSAGLGEPTLNPALVDILKWVALEHPHIAMSLFTNGVLLKHSLQQALIDSKVSWINVSLNAASAATWRELCGVDKFSEVVQNLASLKKLKSERKSIQPLVFATIVLTNRSMHDLPFIPKLCAELGIDRFTGIPVFSFGYGGDDKYGPEVCFQAGDPCYGDIYEKTLLASQQFGISMELPLPDSYRVVSSTVAPRQLHDFGQIEQNEYRLEKLLQSVLPLPFGKRHCFFLWRQASVGSVNLTLGNIEESHYLYPCLGPLSGMNFARVAPVDFSTSVDFFTLWNNPIFTLLRRAQLEEGLCVVCDLCMTNDTRNPELFPKMNECLQSSGIRDLLQA